MIFSIVAAIAENGVIGADGGMPWRLKTDLQRFKAITLNSVVIMGRTTWETLPKPLKDRTHIVLTKDTNYKIENKDIIIAHSLEEAIEEAKKITGSEVFVIGGAKIYNLFLQQNLINKLYITWVLDKPKGDTFFELSFDDWQITYSEEVEKSEKDSSKTIFNIYEKIN